MSQTSAVYVSGHFSEPMTAQHNFTNQYDLGRPEEAMSVYARIMHEHTKRQLNTATQSAPRRSQTMSVDSGSHSITSVNSSDS